MRMRVAGQERGATMAPIAAAAAATLLSLALMLGIAGAVKLPLPWCIHINKVCQAFDDTNAVSPTVMTFENCPKTLMENNVGPEMYLMPPIIVWSPLEQFSMINFECPKCGALDIHGITLHARGWRDGMSGPRSDPRKIYGVHSITLLVCRVYACSKNHEVLGCHPGILRAIPTCFVPFKLWHITGFTLEHIQLIASLLSIGVSICKVREILRERIVWWYHHQKAKFEKINKDSETSFPSHEEWSQMLPNFLPSQHSISSCFLADFWDKEDIYVKVMQNTTIDEQDACLSCDHTFASASM